MICVCAWCEPSYRAQRGARRDNVTHGICARHAGQLIAGIHSRQIETKGLTGERTQTSTSPKSSPATMNDKGVSGRQSR